MLMVRYNEQAARLNFTFDVPMPQTVQTHPSMAKHLVQLAGNSGTQWVRSGNDIAGFQIPVESWVNYMNSHLNARDAAFQRQVLAGLNDPGKELGEGLQVNFHQNSFDTAERYWLFILNQGHFLDYLLNRVNWYLAPRRGIVTPFPLHVDFESASTCNMNCPMCYRDMLKETGQMDFDLFRKGIDECAENGVFSVRLSWRGETLTHPRIMEMIAYACARIKNVSFLTNAFFIDEAIMDCVIEHGVAYLAVSFDGIGDMYERIRAPANYQQNRERLARLKAKRDTAGKTRPQIRLTTVWPAVRHAPEAYMAAMSPVSDYMVVNPYINFKGPMTTKPDFICQYPWERLVVGFDGQTQTCTGWNADDIVLGNLAQMTLAEMWHSKRQNHVRNLHAQGQRMDLSSCAACRHGSKGDAEASIDDILQRRW